MKRILPRVSIAGVEVQVSLLIAGLLLIHDLLYGMPLAYLLVFYVILALPFRVAHQFFKNRKVTRNLFVKTCIYIVSATISLGFVKINNSIAMSNAKPVIEAIKQYKTVNGQYPNTLEELVPNFLSAIPRAKFTLANNRFIYLEPTNSRSPSLMFIGAPFAVRIYSFETGKWSTVD